MTASLNNLDKQLILDLRSIPSMGRADYFVSKSNNEIVSWLDKWPKWLIFGLFLSGPSGSGKTHIANLLKQSSNGIVINNADIKKKNIINLLDFDCVIIEDVDYALSENSLLHLFNFLQENNSKIMLTSKISINKLNLKLPDLQSRLLSLSQVNIGLPDDHLLSRVIIKQFFDKGVKIDIEVVDYLIKRMDRSFKSVENLVTKINYKALEKSKKITVPFVRELLKEL